MAPLMTCWPAESAWTVPLSRVPSARCGRCSLGGAAPWAPDTGLRTLAEVVEYLGLDDRDQFVSGKTQQNA